MAGEVEGKCRKCKKHKKLTHYLFDDKIRTPDRRVCSACAQAHKVAKLPYFRVKKVIDTWKAKTGECDYSLADILRRYQWQGCKCAYCKKFLNDSFTLDHIVARKHGGRNLLFNILVVCLDCNSSKSDFEASFWLGKKGYNITPLIHTTIKGAYDGHGFEFSYPA